MSIGRAIALGLGAWAIAGSGKSKQGLPANPRVIVLSSLDQYEGIRAKHDCVVGTMLLPRLLQGWRAAALDIVDDYPAVAFVGVTLRIAQDALKLEGLQWHMVAWANKGLDNMYEQGGMLAAAIPTNLAAAASACGGAP